QIPQRGLRPQPNDQVARPGQYRSAPASGAPLVNVKQIHNTRLTRRYRVPVLTGPRNLIVLLRA
ncbi:MAG TPA: hypothetical protein VFD63_14230, partial [Pyrinomonadaceae bacterium]|nr:hypothetical protein [Pyrinomonadaceae bacterium]